MSELFMFLSGGLHRTMLPMSVAVVLLWGMEKSVVRLTPNHRCWLWRLLFLKCIVVFFLPLGLPLPGGLAGKLVMEHSPATVTFTGVAQSAPPHAASLPSTVASFPAVSPSTTPLRDADSPVMEVSIDGPMWLFLFWCIGISVNVALLILHHNVLGTRLRRGDVTAIPDSLRQLYAEVTSQMSIARPPQLRLNERFTSPALVYRGRTQIVLPSDFPDRHGKDACRVAIAHELAHYRRHDLLWSMLVSAVSIGLFFFPPLWWARRRYRLAMESACDWEAIRSGRVDSAMYARLLVALTERRPRTLLSLGIVSMSGSESFRSLSERLNAMKRFHLLSGSAVVLRSLVTLLMLCVLAPWTRAQDRYGAERYPVDNPKTSQSSSASVSSSSASFSGSGGQVFSNAQMSANATGNASSSGSASSGAIAQAPGDRNETFSSTAGTAEGNPDRSNGSDREADSNRRLLNLSSSSSSTVIVNGIRLTRSMEAGGQGNRTLLEVLDKKKEYFVFESNNGNRGRIEVHVRDSGKKLGENDNEKVYTANSRDQLKRLEPELVRTIERYEKLAGNAQASVDMDRGRAISRASSDRLALLPGPAAGNAQQMMLDQLRRMQQQHADNPQMQGMLQKMIEDIEKSSP